MKNYHTYYQKINIKRLYRNFFFLFLFGSRIFLCAIVVNTEVL